MDARLLFPNEYLAAADLQGRDVVLTISRLAQEELRTEKGDETKWVLYFREMEERALRDKKKLNKRMVLNRTNAKTIARLHGNETDHWIGKPITLHATRCLAFGQEVDCLRIRDKVTTARTRRAPPREAFLQEPSPFDESEGSATPLPRRTPSMTIAGTGAARPPAASEPDDDDDALDREITELRQELGSMPAVPAEGQLDELVRRVGRLPLGEERDQLEELAAKIAADLPVGEHLPR